MVVDVGAATAAAVVDVVSTDSGPVATPRAAKSAPHAATTSGRQQASISKRGDRKRSMVLRGTAIDGLSQRPGHAGPIARSAPQVPQGDEPVSRGDGPPTSSA